MSPQGLVSARCSDRFNAFAKLSFTPPTFYANQLKGFYKFHLMIYSDLFQYLSDSNTLVLALKVGWLIRAKSATLMCTTTKLPVRAKTTDFLCQIGVPMQGIEAGIEDSRHFGKFVTRKGFIRCLFPTSFSKGVKSLGTQAFSIQQESCSIGHLPTKYMRGKEEQQALLFSSYDGLKRKPHMRACVYINHVQRGLTFMTVA